ncbi:MAG: aminopeptidase P N-terminal domain-containing protein [Sulfurimonas sp.]
MITESEYKKRRERLVSSLSKNSLGIVFSGTYKTRSNDTEFPFRQNSNFYYLTGFTEDNACLIFVKTKKKSKTILLVQKKDKTKELWTGKRLGERKAKRRFLVNEVCTYDKLSDTLKENILEKSQMYYDFDLDYSKVKILKRYAKNLSAYKNIAKPIEAMRLLKSKAEIQLIKDALSITKEAHHKAMQFSKKTEFEYELQAEIEYIFKKNAAFSDAYTSIVACGNAANTLHYVSNNQKLFSGDLILIDAGCEYNYYASDITRTIPVSGKFSQAQKELYEMVLDVELSIINMIKSGVKRSKLQKKSEELLCKGMISLGILKGKPKDLIKKKAHKKYYPHGIGHWMGIDVHDQCPYKDKKGKEIPLKEGMVMTIEPGIYIDEKDKSVPKKYRGIGIRIEDDILVTSWGFENLSKDIAKTISEIESFSS